VGADIKSLRTRIKSVTSTLHLTRAMGLVASSKIRRATERMLHGRDYDGALQQVLSLLTADPGCARSPYMQVAEGKTRLIVIAGDRGLAGGYNANVFRTAKEYPDAEILPIGKRACERFGGEMRLSEKFDAAAAYALATDLCRDFAAGEFARLGILYTRYVSMMSQEPVIRWVLPLTRPTESVPSAAVLFEPDEQTILDAAVPEYVTGAIMAAVRESYASEVVARRMAMDSAGKNATEMIAELQLQYNRARQGSITQEITEIVAGANA